MLTHEELKQKMLSNPEVKAEYDALQEEFSFFDELLRARKSAGLTQSEVAEIMGTKTPAVARLEAGGGNKKHSPSIQTLQKYAKAVGCHLEIKLVQNNLRA
jgi:transcriptional regulator with XRE-family HTH domain